jgi:non-homologous end joining protein Ku
VNKLNKAVFSSFIDIEDITIPVKAYTMEKSKHGLSFKRACPDCESDVGLKNVCKNPECAKEMQWGQWKDKYQITKEDHVIVTDELRQELDKAENIISAVGKIPSTEINPTRIKASYFLVPNAEQEKFLERYGKFLRAIQQVDETIIVTYGMRNKKKQGLLSAQDDCIVLCEYTPDELVVKLDEEFDIPDISKEDIDKAKSVIKGLKKADLTQLKDDYKEKFEEIVNKAIDQNGKTKEPEPEKKLKKVTKKK